ncbi:MAG TPA: FAD-linked oxidase C-terminal domain-containing protein [Chloroflexota bacterium]|nr:FAD-linked oxidase C-terminal domain-containing protein [Chloroflexota bacterium]
MTGVDGWMLAELRRVMGREHALADEAARAAYAGDGSLEVGRPGVVVLPERVDQVVEVVRLASEWGVPLVPRGAGTGLSGGAVAKEGGILLTLTRLNRIKAIDPHNRLAVVEPGVVNAELTRAAAPFGLYYAPDPSSQPACTIGGNVAENSGGAHCLAHGVTTNHVLALEVVVAPDGRRLRLGGPAPDRPGYDLMGLVVGSEGTLAVVTEVTVRLMTRAESVATLLAIFDSARAASETVSAIIAAGVVPVALEMMDGMSARAVEQGLKVGFPTDAGAVLLIELEGLTEAFDAADAHGELPLVQRLCQAHGARSVRTATAAWEREALWKGRKAARGALGRLAPNYYVHDGVVPRSRIPEVIDRIAAIGAAYDLPVATYLHAGDGNLHPNVLFDARRPGEAERAKAAGEAILKACVELGGVLSGEHGIGLEKQAYLPWQLAEGDLRAQAKVKVAWDAAGRLNPSKIFPTPGLCGEIRGASRVRPPRAGSPPVAEPAPAPAGGG